MPTFAAGVGPGTYVQVDFEPAAQVLPTTFVTALIGKTSLDKPTTKTLLRNDASLFTVDLNTDGSVAAGVSEATEGRRRDLLDTVDDVSLDTNGDPLVSSIIDVTGAQRLEGVDGEWVAMKTGALSTDKVHIEWIARYRSSPGLNTITSLNDSPIVVAAAGAGFVTELARITEEDGWTNQTNFPNATDGDHTVTLARDGAGVYSLQLDLTTAVTITAGTGFFEGQIGVGANTVKFRLDRDRLSSLGLTVSNSFTNNVAITTSGPAAGSSVAGGAYDVDNFGTQYAVGYQKPKDADDLDPVTFDNIRAAQGFHGALVATSTTDSLSFGVVPYFRAGGGPVVLAPMRDILIDPTDGFDLTNDAGYVSAVEDALEALEEVAEVTCIVVLSPTETGSFRPGILSAVKSHVLTMGILTAAKPRMGIMGARANTVTEAVFTNNARALGESHLFYVAPATAPLTTGGSTKLGDGSSIAAAVAGIHSNPSIHAGLNISGRSVTVFDDIADPFTDAQKNRMGEINGVCVISKKSGTPTIRHFVTSVAGSSSPLLVEGKVTRLEIDLRKALQQMLDAVLVNTPFIRGEAENRARSFINQYFQQRQADQVISRGEIIKVAQNPTEPRQLDIEVAVQPVFDLNWISLKITLQV